MIFISNFVLMKLFGRLITSVPATVEFENSGRAVPFVTRSKKEIRHPETMATPTREACA